jgi:hypothetical protein
MACIDHPGSITKDRTPNTRRGFLSVSQYPRHEEAIALVNQDFSRVMVTEERLAAVGMQLAD